jgi:uncharacterized protein (TIGR03083 family)
VDYLAAIRQESNRFYDIAEGADPGAGVPSCPGWSIADLVWHLGEVHWFWATDVEVRADNPDQVEAAKPPRPADYAELVAFGRAQVDHLLAALDATPDDTPVWTWALNESDHTAGFVRRHQVQEAAVHRWDLQAAATSAPPDPIDPEAAADSIDEFLVITLPWSVRADKPIAGSVHIHCTDAAGEWLIHADGKVEAVHAKGDVAIRGTASDVLLAIYKRIPLDSVELIGNEELARELVERANTE